MTSTGAFTSWDVQVIIRDSGAQIFLPWRFSAGDRSHGKDGQSVLRYTERTFCDASSYVCCLSSFRSCCCWMHCRYAQPVHSFVVGTAVIEAVPPRQSCRKRQIPSKWNGFHYQTHAFPCFETERKVEWAVIWFSDHLPDFVLAKDWLWIPSLVYCS